MIDNLRIIVSTEEIRLYFNDIKKLPLLPKGREGQIFKLLHDKKTTNREKQDLKTELIHGNLRFVVSVAKQYQNNGLEILDLINEGNIGLLLAIDKFDYKSGNKFISYAVWWIRQNIMLSINENGRTIRIPSNLIQETQKAKKEKVIDDIYYGQDTDLSYTLPSCVDLSKEIDTEGNKLIDVLRDPNEDNPEHIFDPQDDVKRQVNQLLRVLDDREKVIIEKYYGLNGFEVSLEDLGIEFNCTKERVRQIKDVSLKKLRNDSYGLFNFFE